MEAVDIMRALAYPSAFLFGSCLFMTVTRAVNRAKLAALAGSRAYGSKADVFARLMRNGIAPATACARWRAGQRHMAAYFKALCWYARHRGFDTDPYRAGGIVLCGAGLLGIASGLLFASPAFGIAAALCLLVFAGIFANRAREKWQDAMREMVPDALRAMSACFQAGYSLLQTFSYLARETAEPLGSLFRQAESELKTGCAASTALEHMREAATLPELAFVTVALEIQHQSGGSLQKIVAGASDSLESQLALRRSLQVQTAQARLSARIVTVMPFILIAVFSFVSPGFLAPFFSSLGGFAILCVAIGMQCAGVLLVRRLLDVGEA